MRAAWASRRVWLVLRFRDRECIQLASEENSRALRITSEYSNHAMAADPLQDPVAGGVIQFIGDDLGRLGFLAG